jgi:tetratricopeptide (TPR) repeat protein
MTVTQEHKPTFFEQAETFAKKYRNFLLGGLAVIVLGIGYLWYKQHTLNKDQKEAASRISNAQLWYSAGQDSLALHGDGFSMGLLEIVDKYGKTKTGNLANYLAGSCYLRLSDYPNAIKHLDAVKPKSEFVGANAKKLLGDAYAQSGDSTRAKDAYLEAAKMVDNSGFTPTYLKIAADYSLVLGEYKEAEELYQRIRDEYPTSSEGRDIDRFIAYAQQKQL